MSQNTLLPKKRLRDVIYGRTPLAELNAYLIREVISDQPMIDDLVLGEKQASTLRGSFINDVTQILIF